MGNLADEIKKIPAWGWLAAGIIVVGALYAITKSKSSTAATASTGTLAPNSSVGLANSPDQGLVASMTLQELTNIEQLLGGIATTNANLTTSTTATTGVVDQKLADVTGLYSGLLGRAPDTAGASFYTALEGTAGLGAVSSALSNSPEFFNREVTTLYQQQLGRLPDAGGLQFYEQQLANGVSYGAVSATLNQSPEAVALHAGHPAATT